MKLLFQKICQTKENWDEELSLELKQRYEKWITELKNVSSVRIPRCYFSKDESLPSSLQLHGFSDASSYAYAAAVYLRIEQENNVRSVLITSKTRVAPLGGQTIPRRVIWRLNSSKYDKSRGCCSLRSCEDRQSSLLGGLYGSSLLDPRGAETVETVRSE